MRIAIVDHHELFRQGLKSLLRLRLDLSVGVEAKSVEDLVPLLARTPCDILLLEVDTAGRALADLAALAARARVIAVIASGRPEDAAEALRRGAHAVVFKRSGVTELMAAITAVAEGGVWVPPTLQNRLAEQLREVAKVQLSRREIEIIRHVAQGLRNAEVARKLFISEATVKTHLRSIFKKIGIRDRVELVHYAVRAGISGIQEEA